MNNRVFASRVLAGVGLALLAVGMATQHVAAQSRATERFAAVDEAMYRPDFTLSTPDGELRSIDDWSGQVVLIDFWASWCIPCRREMPVFNELRARYADQGFEVVGLAADELDKVRQFLSEVPIEFPIVYGNVFEIMGISEEYGNSYGGLPFSAVIDREGYVRYTQKPGTVSFEDVEEILERLL